MFPQTDVVASRAGATFKPGCRVSRRAEYGRGPKAVPGFDEGVNATTRLEA